MREAKPDKKSFKYWRKCKLPSCVYEFGTNRSWQYFCPKETGRNCQQKWHQLLRKKHEDVIVEMATIKERVNHIEKHLGLEK